MLVNPCSTKVNSMALTAMPTPYIAAWSGSPVFSSTPEATTPTMAPASFIQVRLASTAVSKSASKPASPFRPTTNRQGWLLYELLLKRAASKAGARSSQAKAWPENARGL